VDLIYKRVLISELIERGGLDHPVVRAVRDRAVCMVNPFRCKILHKKASLAVLSDERNAELFTAREREAIEAHIPWTRVVEERGPRYAARPSTSWMPAATASAGAQAQRRVRRGGDRPRLGGLDASGRRAAAGAGRAVHRAGADRAPQRAVPQLRGRPRVSPTGSSTRRRSSSTATTWTAA
jgi:hypothetical protein